MPPERQTTEERAERLVAALATGSEARKRLLVIVNPYATTVSDRLRNLVVYALASRYEVESIDTEKQGHATQLCREAASEGYDAVVAFGGDGTVNEAANGLVGSETPLTCLPGGSTNVFCRTQGIPDDVVEATEHLLGMADRFEPRRVDLGLMNERHFVFASGVGLDASVVERVDSHPRLKSRFGEWYYTYAAVTTFARRYTVGAPRMRVEIGERRLGGATVVVQNSDPFTYFGGRAIRICEGAAVDNGTLSVAVLGRATPFDIPTVAARAFSSRAEVVQRHRHIEGFTGLTELRVVQEGETPLPVQVDGDHIGDFSEVEYRVAPRALCVVS